MSNAPDSPWLTILTPTYNRADRLPLLYESLLQQEDGGFDWLIVDDGSTDATPALVADWQAKGRLPIRYIRRENGGKHRALNTGIQEVRAPLTFIVDSDDALLPNAIHEVSALYRRYGLQKDLCGYSFLTVDKSGQSLAQKALPERELIGRFDHVRFKGNNSGDMKEIWFTDVLRQYPFPEFPGEKFYSEAGVWLRMSGPLRVVFTDIPIYQAEYYADGLTKNRRKSQLSSPLGVMDCSRMMMRRECGLYWNLRAGLLYCVFGRIIGMSAAAMVKASGRPLLTLLCLLPAIPLKKRWTGKQERTVS